MGNIFRKTTTTEVKQLIYEDIYTHKDCNPITESQYNINSTTPINGDNTKDSQEIVFEPQFFKPKE